MPTKTTTPVGFDLPGAAPVSTDDTDPSSPFYSGFRAPATAAPPAAVGFDPELPTTLVSGAAPAAEFDPNLPTSLVAGTAPAEFDPNNPSSRVYTLPDFNSTTPEELAKDKSFSPVQFGAQYFSKGEGTPEEIEKLRQVYVAKEAEGTTALEKAKSTFAGVLPALKTIAGGVKQVAKTAQKFSPEGLAQAVERVGRGESVSDVAAEFVQAAAEIPASVEASAVGTADLLRRSRRVLNENSIRGKFEGGTVSEQNQQQTRERLFNDIEGLKAAERAGQGNGEVMKAVGFDAETLKESGIVLDPDAIAKLSVITDPINYIPVGGAVAAVSKIGGKAFQVGVATALSAEQATKFAKVLNSATEAAAKGRSVAATATGAVAQAAGGAIEGAGNVAQRAVKSVGGTAGGLGLGALLGRDIYSVLGGVAAAKVAPKVISATGRGIKAGGEILSGTRAAPAALSLAGDAAKAGAVGAAKGLAEGATISLPFELGARPEEEEQVLGMVGLAGAIRGGVEGGRPVARAAGRAAQNKLAESIFQRVEQTDAPESPTYGTEPTLDSAHSAAVATLPAPSQKLVNWGRELLREAGGEVYTLTNDEFVKAAGDNGVGYAVKIGEKIAPDGSSTPLVRIFLNASSEGLPHEFFHALESIDPAQADGLRKAVQAEWTPQQKKSFEQYYNTLRNGGLPESQWKTRLSAEGVASEAAAEVFSRLFLAQDLTGVSPSITQKAALFTSSIIDKLGSPLAAVGRARGEAGVSTLGVRPGVESTKLGQAWLVNLLQRVDETGSLGEAPKPTKAFEGLTPADITDTRVSQRPVSTPAPAPAPAPAPSPIAPAPTTPVTPAPSGSRNIRTTRAAQNDFAGRRAEETGTVRARAVAKASADPNTIARVAEISDLIESGSPVIEIEHSGAIAEGNARKPSGRTARRTEQEAAYIAEGLGAAPESIRETYQKVFVPVRWETVAGKPQLLAMSLDKVIANAHKVANEASVRGVGDLVPYEISGGKLTEAGWKSFVSDLRDYAANQQNGFRGDGQRLTRPATDIGLSIPAENPGYNPVRLDEAKANFLNVVQGLNPPRTAREGSNLAKAVPGNVKGQILAEVNARTPERPAVIRPEDIAKQDFKSQPGRSIKETNPLRNQLAEAGVPVRELIEVTERINAENINKVKPRPDLDFSAPVTDTIRGGFLPSNEPPGVGKGWIRPDGVFEMVGQNHSEAGANLYDKGWIRYVASRDGNDVLHVDLNSERGRVKPNPKQESAIEAWKASGASIKDDFGSFLPAPESGATVGDSVAKVLNATPDEFVALTKQWDGSLTKEAYRVGLNAKSVNDLFMLKTAQEAARARYKRAFATGNEQDGYSLSVMPQFFREAYEAATDSGSAAGKMGWRMSYPDAIPPFPEQAGQFMPAPVFYSELQRVVDEKVKGDSIPASQLAGLVRNSGIKPEELKWSGLDEYLAGRDKVSVPELKKFLRENEVQLEEVVKGKESPPQTQDEISQRIYGVDFDELRTNQRNHVRGIFIDEEEAAVTTKFENYQVPGGENYRELLLTLPEQRNVARTEWEAYRDELFSKYKTESQIELQKKATKAEFNSLQELGDSMNRSGERRFQSSHFDEPNVLAHVRFNERRDSGGGKVLFLEEVQSDWHQAGKKKGYQEHPAFDEAFEVRPPTEAERKRGVEDNFIAARRGEGDTGIDFIRGAGDTAEAAKKAALENPRLWDKWESGVPDAPFKKTWPLLAVKRMIRYAAENGFDKVAWTPGDIQAARYDLSKQVDSIGYAADGPDSWYIRVKKDGKTVLDRDNQTLSDLETLVGKDVAQKISDGVGHEAGSPKKSGTITGDNLKVGGEGMRGFYDQILPKEVGNYVKKWGAKVEKLPLTPREATFSEWRKQTYPGQDATPAMRKEYAALNLSLVETPVWSVTLTPSMRSDVLTKGQKMFLPRGDARIAPAEVQRRTAPELTPLLPRHISGSDRETP